MKGIADKVKSKWKTTLGMARRLILEKWVIQGMLFHIITVYSWPFPLLEDLEKWWYLQKEGGVRIMSIIILNYASERKWKTWIWSGIKPEYATLFVNTLWFLEYPRCTAALIDLFNVIWYVRNQARFND